MVSPLAGITRDDVDRSERSQWRYRAALPLEVERRVSLGEGCAPLLPAEFDDIPVLVKPEWFNPTASFKDRGTTVMISVIAGQGIAEILEDSSGNAGSPVVAHEIASAQSHREKETHEAPPRACDARRTG